MWLIHTLIPLVGVLVQLAHAINEGTRWYTTTAFIAIEDGVPTWIPLVMPWYLDDDANWDREDKPPEGLENVITISSTNRAYTALKADGTVTVWGDVDTGGNDTVPSSLTNVRAVFASTNSFVALMRDKTVASWGSPLSGGLAHPGLTNVKTIVSCELGFAALKEDGSVLSWGAVTNGGFIPLNLNHSIQKIYPAKTYFVAVQPYGRIDPSDVWGAGEEVIFGNFTEPLYNISAVYTTDLMISAYSSCTGKMDILVRSGFSSWYYKTMVMPPENMTSSVVHVATSRDGFAGLMADGTVIEWGIRRAWETAPALQDIIAIYATSTAFAAMSSTGTVTMWGDTTGVIGGISAVYTSKGAFAFITEETKVIACGWKYNGGVLPKELSGIGNVIKIFSIETYFAILTADGMVYTWGDAVGNEYASIQLNMTKLDGIYASNQYLSYSTCAVEEPDSYVCGTGHSCDAGTYYVAMSASSCLSCSPGTVSGHNATYCEQCPTGKYYPSSGGHVCLDCPRGHYSTPGSAYCSGCPAGKYIGQGSIECMPCPVGFFSPSVGDQSCEPCSTGRYAGTEGMISCTLCSRGKAGDVTQATSESEACKSCLPSTYAAYSGSSQCALCPPGSFCPDSGMSDPDACSAGKFAVLKGSLFCDDCPAGRFQSQTGEAMCDLCAAGKYNVMNGSSSGSDCQLCPTGTATYMPGYPVCIDCGHYAYTEGVGSSVCFECPKHGQVSNEEGNGCVIDTILQGPSLMDEIYENGTALVGAFSITAGFMVFLYVVQWQKRGHVAASRKEEEDQSVWGLEAVQQRTSGNNTTMRNTNAGGAANNTAGGANTEVGILDFSDEIFTSGTSGFAIGNDLFIILGFSVTAPKLAIAMIFFRLLHLVIAGLVLTIAFGPRWCRQSVDSLGFMRRGSALHFLIADEFAMKSKALIGIVMLACLCDCSLLIFLPWTESKMFTESHGFPTLSVMRWCKFTKVVQCIGSGICQMYFVLSTQDKGTIMHTAESQAQLGMNIALAIGNVLYGIMMFCVNDGIFRKVEKEERGADATSNNKKNSSEMQKKGETGDDNDDGDAFRSARSTTISNKTNKNNTAASDLEDGDAGVEIVMNPLRFSTIASRSTIDSTTPRQSASSSFKIRSVINTATVAGGGGGGVTTREAAVATMAAASLAEKYGELERKYAELEEENMQLNAILNKDAIPPA
jgi:hypothetical protein